MDSHFLIKTEELDDLIKGSNLKLELGCGAHKRDPLALGLDLINYPTVDIVGDAHEFLECLPDNCVAEIFASHFVEHVDDLANLTRAMARVVKPGGTITLVAPHFSSPYFYSDPTHRTFFGLYTFAHYAANSLFARKVPRVEVLPLTIESVDLVFKSSRPFVFRYALKSLVGRLFNSSNFMKEFYEENLCWVFPCYEIRYLMVRQKDPT